MKHMFAFAAAATAIVFAAEPAFAQAGGIGDVAKSLTDNLKTIPTLIGTAAQAVGIWACGKAAYALKEMSENGHDRDSARKALLSGVAGVMLVALPSMMGVGMQTLFATKEGNLTQTNGVISIK
jgi:hypothetical protein